MKNDMLPPERTIYDDVEGDPERVLAGLSRVGASDDRIERLQSRLEKHEKTIGVLARELGAVNRKLAKLAEVFAGGASSGVGNPRRATPKPFRSKPLLSDSDMKVGGQYIFTVAHPRRPYQARAMILGIDSTDPETGEILYRFVRADNGRNFRPKPASAFSPVPADWKDPASVEDEEDDRASRRPSRGPSSRPGPVSR